MQIENRCPHSIAVVDTYGREWVILKTAPPVRIETTQGTLVGYADGVPVFGPPGWKGFTNLPDQRDGVTIVVSQIVGRAVNALPPDRTDVVYLGTAPKDGAIREPGRGVMTIARFIRAV
jgi:hypothetical protein